MDLRTIFANCNKQKLGVSYGYFVHWHHDLYGGINYTGVFDSEKKAKEFANKQTGYDEIHILFLPYIQFEGKIYALWEENAANCI
jgi:hypothetical protein